MPFFSFSLKKNFLNQKEFPHIAKKDIKNDTIYYSKNTKLWKTLNKKSSIKFINFVSFEKREPSITPKDSILFCLPPSMGLGDLIEYAIFIEKLEKSKKFKKVGVAFIGKYSFILKKYFNIKHIFLEVISKEKYYSFNNQFHVSLEVEVLKLQKYNRKDINKYLSKYFGLNVINKNFKKFNKTNLAKITIFPVSKSPIRSLSPFLINKIIKTYKDKLKIEIVLDSSDISHFIKSKLLLNNINIIKPKNLEELSNVVDKIEFGIFMDSGPLHLAKLLNKKGILIVTSVSHRELLNENENIFPIQNNFKSKHCSSPCGLTNVFNLDGKIGCFQSLKISRENFFKIKNLNSLQRGNIKDSYVSLISKPVGCVENININKLTNLIDNIL
ncbi:hypothetical protein OAJ89_04815 [Alphaproteobacteria bacterium]|nr:hypothetical protein [Alphaproteobacteria bacterium]